MPPGGPAGKRLATGPERVLETVEPAQGDKDMDPP